MEATNQQRRAFGEALQQHASDRGLSLADLAAQLGQTYEAIRKYARGEREPSPPMAFRIEEAVGVEPGTLSQYLGYLPTSAQSTRPASVLEAIEADARLTRRMKDGLAASYRALIGEPG